MQNNPQTAREGLRQDLSDIIEFPQYPKGRIATRDLRGKPMSSTELSYKVSLILERLDAYVSDEVRQARLSERKEIALDNYRGHTFSESTNWQAKFQKFIANNERRIAQLTEQERTE